MAKKKFKSYSEHTDKASTERYATPTQLVQPAENDKGFAMFKRAFDANKTKYVPSISW